jgi:hypothetical protein
MYMHTFLLLALVAASSAFPRLFGDKPVFSSFQESFDAHKDVWQKLDRTTFKLADHPFQAPGPNDVRSSCPFLSTCANHGIIPRDGRNIHFESLYRCAHFGGFGKTMFRISRASFAKIAEQYRVNEIKALKYPVRPRDRIGLDEASFHGPIEHDLSISRIDVKYPETFDGKELNSTGVRDLGLVKGLLEYAIKKPGCSVKQVTKEWLENPNCQTNDDKCYLDVEDMGRWHQERRRQETEHHKGLGRPIHFTLRELIAASGEATFFMYLMGRHGKITAEHARMFLVNQRFPDDWKPVTDTFHFPKIAPLIGGMALSYIKPRGGDNTDYGMTAKVKEMVTNPAKIYGVLIQDYGKQECTGSSDVCLSYEAAMAKEQ